MSPPSYATKPDLFPLDGGCSCGHIRYRLRLPPLIVHCCHCTACQRETGGAFAINALIESEHMELLPSAAPSVPGTRDAPEGKPAGPPLEGSFVDAVSEAESKAFTSSANPDKGIEAEAGSKPEEDPRPETPATIPVPIPQESSSPQVIHRCPRCATALWSYYGPRAEEERVRYVRAGTLDRAWEVEPDVHIYVKSKRDFVQLADGKPVFDELYDPRAEYRADSLDRLALVLGKMKL